MKLFFLKIEHLLPLNIKNGELPHMDKSKLLLSDIKYIIDENEFLFSHLEFLLIIH